MKARLGICVLIGFGLLCPWTTTTTAVEKVASPPTLLGKWKSDLVRTMDFNLEHVKLESQQVAALKTIFGKNTLEFTESECRITCPPVSFERKGMEINLEESEETIQYELVATTPNAVAIKTDDKELFGEALSIWHFDGDYVWTYVGDSPVGLHLREYFKRVK